MMRLIDADALRQAILSTMPERSEVLLIVDNQPEVVTGMADLNKTIDGLERLRFFNQRAGRELWKDKPHDVQELDIASADMVYADALELLKSQQAEIELLKEKDRLHCEDCAYNGICETPHTDKSPLCAEYSIVR